MNTTSHGDFLYHSPCETCGSSDARAVYTDGHSHCFSCGTTVQGEAPLHEAADARPKKRGGLMEGGDFQALRTRGITLETAQHFGYRVKKTGEGAVQIAPYFDAQGRLVAQKLRRVGKEFSWRGELTQSQVLPFGHQAFQHTGRMITVTEGEIDAMAMSQVQGNKFPVVSIPTGATAKTVAKYFAKHHEYFAGFGKVVLMFDMDEPGQAAAQAAAEVLGPRAAIAKLPLKDAADMLKAGRTAELIDAMWKAKPFRPEGIVDLASLRDEVLRPIEWGLSWPFPALTALTYGIRLGELYAFGAGTGIGKTDVFTQTMAHLMEEHDEKVGIFSLEQEPKETGLRLMGKLAKKPFHIPDQVTPDELADAWSKHVEEGKVFLYDSFGINEWDVIRDKIRYLRDAEDVKYFFLDHLTALAAGEDDERVALERIMAQMGSLVKEKPITIFFISHLATPEGKPHEEGGRVMIRHFKGSRAIGFWSHFMFGLERNQQHENEVVRATTTFRVLKDRYTGRATGQLFYLGYGHDTGQLFETAAPDETAGAFSFSIDS